MTDGLVTSGIPDPLEERLTRALPRLKAHVALRARQVPGIEAEDVAQEVMARALRYRESYDEKRALWPWLRRIAEHVLHNHRAAGARQPLALESEPWVRSENEARPEVLEELTQRLASLRPVEREVLLRFHRKSESVREIALAMRMPEGTVKSHLSRARRRLAEQSEEGQPHE